MAIFLKLGTLVHLNVTHKFYRVPNSLGKTLQTYTCSNLFSLFFVSSIIEGPAYLQSPTSPPRDRDLRQRSVDKNHTFCRCNDALLLSLSRSPFSQSFFHPTTWIPPWTDNLIPKPLKLANNSQPYDILCVRVFYLASLFV